MRNNIFYSLLLLLSCSVFSACTREVSEMEDEHRYFFKRFGDRQNQGFKFINASLSGKLFVQGFDDNDTVSNGLTVTFDKFGKEVNRTLYPRFQSIPLGSRFQDGSFVLGDVAYNWLASYDAAGNLLAEGEFGTTGNNTHIHGEPIKLKDGKIAFGMTNGIGSGVATSSIVILDPSLQIEGIYSIFESDVNGHLTQLEIDRVDGNDFYYSGTMYRNPWSFSNPFRSFVARFNLTDPTRDFVIHIPPADSLKNDIVIDRVVLNDEGLVQVLSGGSWLLNGWENHGGKSFDLLNWDSERNLRWRKSFSLGFAIHSPIGISTNKRGELFVVGNVCNGNNDPFYPFVIKMDKEGNVLWKKVYYEIFDGVLTDVHENVDGDLLFCGYLELFGRKSEAGDGIILKTDAYGNY